MRNSIKTKIYAVILILFISAPIMLKAADEEAIVFPWQASLSVGRMQFEGDEELDNGLITSLRLGYDYNDRWTFESSLFMAPNLSANTTEFSEQDDSSMFGLAADGLFHFTRWNRIDPYLSAGLGFTRYDEELKDGNQSDITIRGGGGVQYHFNDTWSARADFRGMLAGFGESPNANSIIDIGIVWHWGASKGSKPSTPVINIGPDADGDGLSDEEEAKLGTDYLNPDTDGDGVKDGEEVNKRKTDPLKK